jgi:hypothetical protein
VIVRAPTKSLDDALDAVAALAKIPEDSKTYFRDLLRDTVDAAIPGIKKMRLSDESITHQLKAVTYKARSLLASLRKIEVSEAAGLSLRAAAMDRGLTLKHFADQLELLAEVAEAAGHMGIARSKRSTAGRPPGTPGNLGFDLFVQQLLMDARAAGGNLTIFKSVDGDYRGSLLKTIELLRAHLPRSFVQGGDLGRRLHRIVHGR